MASSWNSEDHKLLRGQKGAMRPYFETYAYSEVDNDKWTKNLRRT